MVRKAAHARWISHVNGVNPPPRMRGWLTDRVSLTAKLIGLERGFRVQRLRQQRRLCLSDEAQAVGLPHRRIVLEREVLLRCDDRPVVFAHTIVPLAATSSDWPFFGALGERSLGTSLFRDPKVVRGELQYARLHAGHPLVRRAAAVLTPERQDVSFPLYARRCLFRRRQGLLLVTEIFLPELLAIEPGYGPAARSATGRLNIGKRIKRNQ